MAVVGDHELFGGFGIHSYTLPWKQRTSNDGLTGGAYKDLQAYGPPINPLDLRNDATPTPYSSSLTVVAFAVNLVIITFITSNNIVHCFENVVKKLRAAAVGEPLVHTNGVA